MTMYMAIEKLKIILNRESDESYRIRFILESERIKEILDFENDMWGY